MESSQPAFPASTGTNHEQHLSSQQPLNLAKGVPLQCNLLEGQAITVGASICDSSSSNGGNQSSTFLTRELFYRAAAFERPIESSNNIKPRRRKISKDPQTVAARHRRQRVSQKMRTLQQLVPGGTKMDIVSMLEEAVQYIKFLKEEVRLLEQLDYATNTTA